jgi:uncharacterized protein with PQ loop repeat
MTPQHLEWLGSVLLACAGIPQAVKVIREGHAQGMAGWYLTLLWFGFLSMVFYTIGSHAAPQLAVSYYLQLVIFSVIIKYKIWPKSSVEVSTDEVVR